MLFFHCVIIIHGNTITIHNDSPPVAGSVILLLQNCVNFTAIQTISIWYLFKKKGRLCEYICFHPPQWSHLRDKTAAFYIHSL